MCGQGPLTRTLDQMRAVLAAAAPTVRTGPSRPFTLRGAFLWTPDDLGEWPSFATDFATTLRRAAGEVRFDHGLPGTTRVRNIYHSVWASNLEALLEADTLSLAEGIRAVLSAVVFRGRFGDRRFHPASAELLMMVALGRITLYRDARRAKAAADAVRDQISALWDRGYLIAMPVCTFSAPKIGRANYNPNLLACTFPGNLADATGLSIPFGRFEASGLPRSIQLLGPPGSEAVLIDAAERMLSAE
jgi:Asp-tRNA(Asn)/Glu-tRNA(Gln) amidotransferase A subunit family amidase